MANAPGASGSFPVTYIASSLAESTPANIHDYSLWYHSSRLESPVQRHQHEEPSLEPSPVPEQETAPEPEPNAAPVSFQAPVSPRTLRNMYDQLPSLPSTPPPLDSTAKNRLRREKAKEKERQRPGISAMLPDEIIIDPPHDPDEKIAMPYVRSCSMTRQDVPHGMRCVVMLRADYEYRMCEGCRMRFKLAEVRSKGIRYQGKFKAREENGDGRGTRHAKPRPHLIQYMGELILDPAFMHLYELDPRMFGPEATKLSSARNEEMQFLAALKAAEIAVGLKSSEREGSAEGRQSTEPTGLPTPLPTPVIDSELALAMPHLTGASSSATGMSSATPAIHALPESAISTQKDPLPKQKADDGLLRVRICTVRNCHSIVPIDYAWKMCASCRDNYKVWGVVKRQRQRERRLQKMTPEEREKFEQISKERARKEGEEEGEAVEFDPTIPPKPCSVLHCKNHLPGNTPWTRCDYHRLRDGMPYSEQLAKKRENPKQIYAKAMEEGRDPVEAIKAFLLSKEAEDHANTSDGGGAARDKDGRFKRKHTDRSIELKENDDHIDVPKKLRKTSNMTVCAGKSCSNVLTYESPYKLCEPCRDQELATHPLRMKRIKKDSGSTFEAFQFVVPQTSDGNTPTHPPATTFSDNHQQGLQPGSVVSEPCSFSVMTATNNGGSVDSASRWAGVVNTQTSGVGWSNYYAQPGRLVPAYKTAESSLQGAIVMDSRDDASSGGSAQNPPSEPPFASPLFIPTDSPVSHATTRAVHDHSFRPPQTAPVDSDQQPPRNITFLPPKTSGGTQTEAPAHAPPKPSAKATTVPDPPSPSAALAEAIAKVVGQLPASATDQAKDPSSATYSTPISEAIAKAVANSATLSSMIANASTSTSSDALASAIAKAIAALPTPVATSTVTVAEKPASLEPPPAPRPKRQYKKRAVASASQSTQVQTPQPQINTYPVPPASAGVYPYGTYPHYPAAPNNPTSPYPSPPQPQQGPASSSTQSSPYHYAPQAYTPHVAYPPPTTSNSLPSQPQYPFPYPYPYIYAQPYLPSTPAATAPTPLAYTHPTPGTDPAPNNVSPDSIITPAQAHPPSVASHSPTKTCESPKCTKVLSLNYSHKHCLECRKLLKAKKRVTDMKRRLKLGGK